MIFKSKGHLICLSFRKKIWTLLSIDCKDELEMIFVFLASDIIYNTFDSLNIVLSINLLGIMIFELDICSIRFDLLFGYKPPMLL